MRQTLASAVEKRTLSKFRGIFVQVKEKKFFKESSSFQRFLLSIIYSLSTHFCLEYKFCASVSDILKLLFVLGKWKAWNFEGYFRSLSGSHVALVSFQVRVGLLGVLSNVGEL